MADTRIQKLCVQPSSVFRDATGKKMTGDSDTGPGVSSSTGAFAGNPIAAGCHDKENCTAGGVRICSRTGNPIAAGCHDKENCTAGGVRICSRRSSPLPSWYQRTPLRDVTAIIRAMESRRQEKKLLSAVKPPMEEIEDEGIGDVTWSPSTPVSSCSPIHVFIDEATPVAAAERRYSVPGMAARWMVQATVTDCDDDKGCPKSTKKLNFGKLKKDLPARTGPRSSLMSMR